MGMRSLGSQLGVHRLSVTHTWEAAKFDDAYTGPTPCLLLSGLEIFPAVIATYISLHESITWRDTMGKLSKTQGKHRFIGVYTQEWAPPSNIE